MKAGSGAPEVPLYAVTVRLPRSETKTSLPDTVSPKAALNPVMKLGLIRAPVVALYSSPPSSTAGAHAPHPLPSPIGPTKQIVPTPHPTIGQRPLPSAQRGHGTALKAGRSNSL